MTLTTIVGKAPKCQTVQVNSTLVKADTPYNILLSQPTLNALKVVFSTYHLKFPTPAGVAEVTSDLRLARECHLDTTQPASSAEPSSQTPSSDRNSARPSCLESGKGHPYCL